MCESKNKFGFEWFEIKNEQLPPIDEEIVFSSGIREFVGTMDSSFEIWEFKENNEIEYHSNLKDEYITHFRYK